MLKARYTSSEVTLLNDAKHRQTMRVIRDVKSGNQRCLGLGLVSPNVCASCVIYNIIIYIILYIYYIYIYRIVIYNVYIIVYIGYICMYYIMCI